jgi:hypothetical protein
VRWDRNRGESNLKIDVREAIQILYHPREMRRMLEFQVSREQEGGVRLPSDIRR